MDKRIPKHFLIAAAIFGLLLLIYLAHIRPGYFTDPMNLGGLLVLQLLLATLWNYRQYFFPVLILSFLFAGSNLPVGTVWTAARWGFLGIGAAVGVVLVLKDARRHSFGFFHAVAGLCILAAAFSAGESRYPDFAAMKVAGLALLFLYTSTGARLAAAGREERFMDRLVVGCEWLVGINAVFYIALGVQAMGNPNSLGAVMGVAAMPILLWGVFVTPQTGVQRRRILIFAICVYLVYYSHSRAAMMAATVSCGLLCAGLRKYRLLTVASIVMFAFVAVYAIVQPAGLSNSVSRLSYSVIYKQKPNQGVFSSRSSPWQDAIDSIQSHFWLGTGFGTSDSGQDASAHLGTYATVAEATAEHGSSYLAITAWVGVAGALPFFLLMILVARKALRTIAWLFRTRNVAHPAIPIALVMVAGLIHAGFEDWMFAAGYYLSVFYWSMAFILIDLAPAPAVARVIPAWSFRSSPRNLEAAAPNA